MSEPFEGRIIWRTGTQFSAAEDTRRKVFASVIPDGERIWAFVPSVIELDRKFIRRLGAYCRDAHRELVGMLDWTETKGFDIQVADNPAVHAAFGSFSFEGTRRDNGVAEDMHGNILWTAFPEKAPTAMRRLRATMAIGCDDAFHNDADISGEFEAECSFVGRLAECGGVARSRLIGRMGWNAGDGDFDVRPC